MNVKQPPHCVRRSETHASNTGVFWTYLDRGTSGDSPVRNRRKTFSKPYLKSQIKIICNWKQLITIVFLNMLMKLKVKLSLHVFS